MCVGLDLLGNQVRNYCMMPICIRLHTLRQTEKLSAVIGFQRGWKDLPSSSNTFFQGAAKNNMLLIDADPKSATISQ